MIKADTHFAETIDTAIADSLENADSRHAVVPVRSVAQSVLEMARASPDDYSTILQLVCERSIFRGHVLAFEEVPFRRLT